MRHQQHKHGSFGRRRHDSAAARARASFLRANPLCVMCEMRGVVRAAEEVDHVISLAQGGSDDDGNKQALCKPCHRVKTAQEQGYTPRGCDQAGNPVGGWPR